jgi:glycosyltransferase involved in cell wall biosynthesis
VSTRKHILFLVTEDWYFCSHRLSLARAALAAGYAVSVATRVREHGEMIEAAGLRLIPLKLSRRSRHLARETRLLYDLFRLYRREKPDLVHQVALKPVLYGTLAARLAGVPAIVNALAGLGFLFVSERRMARILRPVAELAFRRLLNHANTRTILQNPDDLHLLAQRRILEARFARLIRGSGVDLARFRARPEPEGPPLVILPARMLWDKGVGEFVAAAQRLRSEGIRARLALVGDRDAENPSAIASAQLQEWHRSGVVEWWGQRTDMERVFADCHVVCLPSYREGLPKALLEAAASGRPIVTTDVPGCREIVREGENGLLVPKGDPIALAAALRRLIEDPDLRHRMGKRGSAIAASEFSLDEVIRQTLALYQEMLGS